MASLRKNILSVFIAALTIVCVFIFIDCNKKAPDKNNESVNTQYSKHYDYLNISKDVKYVGDTECADCHRSIYDSYKKTEMGRSYYKPSKDNMIEDFSKNNIVYDSTSRLYYKMTYEDGNFYQTEYMLDGDKQKVNELRIKVDYIIGSGMHTRSYITSTNGYLSEMPVTWYILMKKWDMSPGYKEFKLRFTRPIVKECMDCHNSHGSLVKNSDNRYHEPLPSGIGCERCHGPGELHVKHHNEVFKDSGYISDAKNFIDRTIVNPSHLPNDLKMDVCSQCHLQGEQTIFKPGKTTDDFYPGMNLNEVKSVFLKDSVNEGDFTIASHTARLVNSKCFKNSGGKLVCTYCHNPHVSAGSVPKQDFNGKCLTCHETAKLPNVKSADHTMSGNCVKCHMLQGGVADIPHVNFTDHWIRKNPSPVTAAEISMTKRTDETIKLKDFFNYRENDVSNLGIAYVLFYEAIKKKPEYVYRAIDILKEALQNPNHNAETEYYLGTAFLDINKPFDSEEYLKNYTARFPDDMKGHLSLALVYEQENKLQNAINEYNLINNKSAENPFVFSNLGNAYAKSNKYNEAISAFRTAISLQPIQAPFYNNLGNFYFNMKNVDSSIVYFREALHYNPILALGAFNLGNAYMTINQLDEAENWFNRVIEIEPSNAASYGNLSIIYQKKNDIPKAVYFVKKSLEINANNPTAQKMLKSLEQQQKLHQP